MNHLDDDVLSAYTFDGEGAPEVEAHLEQCDVCRSGVTFYREIESALRGQQTWTTVDTALKPGSRVAEILEYRRRKEEEEREARAFLERVISSPLKFQYVKIADKPRYRTEGMVRVLCAEANARHEQRPTFSRQIAAAAYDVARQLTNVGDREKRGLMGMALREHANALRYLGRFKDALKLLDYAEKLFDGTPGADPFDLAIVKYIRAAVFQESDRLPEGISAARDAAAMFRVYGDVTRERCALLIEANCLCLSRRLDDAVSLYEQVIALSRTASDPRMLVRALSNCATALTDLGQFDRAERCYIEALVLHDELEMVTEKARAEWALAALTLARGNLVDGVRQLDESRKALAKLGLTNDAAAATLEWAEARLALEQPAGVAEECRDIVVTFETEDMLRHARYALAVLNEALAAGRATPGLVHNVRVYLERLPTRPAEAFLPT